LQLAPLWMQAVFYNLGVNLYEATTIWGSYIERHNGQHASINSLSIESFFHVVLILKSQGIAKPGAAIFERVLESLDVKDNESCYLGDHLINDIEAARTVGLMTIWKKNDPEANADEVIDKLPEIVSILKGRSVHELFTNDA
jgi:putative hydrolase of the HAD superfamily